MNNRKPGPARSTACGGEAQSGEKQENGPPGGTRNQGVARGNVTPERNRVAGAVYVDAGGGLSAIAAAGQRFGLVLNAECTGQSVVVATGNGERISGVRHG